MTDRTYPPGQERGAPGVPADPAAPRAATRLPVPASLFHRGRTPHFALFDSHGGSIDPVAARTVHISPADAEGLREFLLERLSSVARDQDVPPADLGWAVTRLLVHEASDLVSAHGRPGHRSTLDGVLRQLVRLAARGTQARSALLPALSSIHTPVAHSVDTALYATVLATAHGVDDEEQLTDIALAGLFADISKMHMSRSMLQRQGPLRRDEWAVMRRHPDQSAQIMARFSVGAPAARAAVRFHHERWDGNGYGERLVGTDIPFEARCLAIADVYSALVVERPAGPAMTAFEALRTMSHPPGQFDPSLLRTFVRLLGDARPVALVRRLAEAVTAGIDDGARAA